MNLPLSIQREALRDAARLGLQGGVAGAVAYLVARWSAFLDPFLVILMAAGSLHRSVGGTMGEALTRLQAALAGTVLGLACLVVFPAGWGTAALLGLALFVVVAASALRPAWALGVVPAVGLTLGGDGPVVEAAVATCLGVAAGVGIGVTVALLVWPDRAEARFERHHRQALRATATRLSDALEAATERGHPARVPEHLAAWSEAVWLAQEAVSVARFVDRAPMQARLDALRALHDAVIILDRAAEAEETPAAGDDLRGEVEAVRRQACEVLTRLAEGKCPDGWTDGVDAALGRLGDAIAAEDAAAPAHEARTAVGFGLHEVRRRLSALIEAEAAR